MPTNNDDDMTIFGACMYAIIVIPASMGVLYGIVQFIKFAWSS